MVHSLCYHCRGVYDWFECAFRSERETGGEAMGVRLFTDPRMLEHRFRRTTRNGPSGCGRSCGISSARATLPPVRTAWFARRPMKSWAGFTRPITCRRVVGGIRRRRDARPGYLGFARLGLAARLAAGAGDRGSLVRDGGARAAGLCALSVRPDITPGRQRAWAFASTRNIAVAAAEALARFELNRVLIVDFDVHHGNGTQEVFYDISRVGFLSIHRYPFYPGTGAQDETGARRGLGHTLNIPWPTAPDEASTTRRSARVWRRWPTASGPSLS